jgi:hypothetical protein
MKSPAPRLQHVCSAGIAKIGQPEICDTELAPILVSSFRVVGEKDVFELQVPVDNMSVVEVD